MGRGKLGPLRSHALDAGVPSTKRRDVYRSDRSPPQSGITERLLAGDARAAGREFRQFGGELACTCGEPCMCHATVPQHSDVCSRVAGSRIEMSGQPFASLSWIGPVACFDPALDRLMGNCPGIWLQRSQGTLRSAERCRAG